MQIINLHQGTEEWHAWRATRRMASESPALLGLSPWQPKTPLQLFELKTGLTHIEQTPAMLHGIVNEGRAREQYEGDHNCRMAPCVVEGEHGYAASLDGRREDGRRIVEIKCPVQGSRSLPWAEAFIKRTLTHHQAQIQHQLMVSGAKACDLVVYAADIDSYELVEVEPDLAMQARIHRAWEEFWPLYASQTPPEPIEGDYIERFDAEWMELEISYNKAEAALKGAEAEKERVRKEILALAGDASCRGASLQVTRYWAKGNVDYGKIPALKGFDCEPFRKKGGYRFRIGGMKEKWTT